MNGANRGDSAAGLRRGGRRGRPTAAILTAATLVMYLAPPAAGQPAADAPDFQTRIRPLLSDRCFSCHGPDAEHRQADLRLDQREAAVQVLSPGAAHASLVLERITASDPDVRMPPPDSGKELNAEEIELLRAWIQQGAEYTPYWAYQPPRRHEIPSVRNEAWCRNWIDHFILARLEAKGWTPAADADEVTLVRRLHFDLTGLPPSPDVVRRYLESDSPSKYEDLVDQLLHSPAYGERMAAYWLDLVRYADTVGYHGDQDHSISPYRDWVIEAFNNNMRWNEFTRDQLAGDLVESPTIEQRIATGYNRLLQTSHEGGVQPQEYLAIYAADRVRNLSAVWLGATLGCAQCHDHKYDPFTSRDFYAMAAFFADIDEEQHFERGTNDLPTRRPPEITVYPRGIRDQVPKVRAEFEKLQGQFARLMARDGASGEKSKEMVRLQADLDQAKARLSALEAEGRMTMVTVAKPEPRITRILPRGNWLDESGEIVEPAPPQFLGRWTPGDARGTRLDLARWLTAVDQGVGGLTARVFANRWWYLMFGDGLARVLDDFGGQGEPPSHPELLDTLAVEFHESGWDVRRMIRLLVTSRTYRQSSLVGEDELRRDPYNRWCARQASFRLPAEMVRDGALAVSGLLVRDFGGKPVKPYQPTGYYRHLNFPEREYEADQDSRQWRRAVYMHWQRQFLHPMLKAMDAPSREECTAKRPQSNTPLAALVLLNDPSFVEAARALAGRVLRESGLASDEDGVRWACRQVLSRDPDSLETSILTDLLHSSRAHYGEAPQDAEALISVGLSPRDKQLAPAPEWAAWTMVCRALLNLGEAVTRY